MSARSLTLDDLRKSGRATITVEEAAGVLDVSRGVAYRSVKDGTLPSLSLGRRLVVPVPALLRLLGVEPSSNGEATDA